MTITITDPVLLAQLKSFPPGTELIGPNGELLAKLKRPIGPPPPGYRPAISDDEFERRCREDRDGQTLDEVWRDIKSGRA